MGATGMESWASVRPHHVTRRVGLGDCRPYDEIFPHLQVQQGELLEQKGPEKLLRIWNDGEMV